MKKAMFDFLKDFEPGSTYEDEIEDEILFEKFLKSRKKRITKNREKFVVKNSIRRDVAESFEFKNNEMRLRKLLADILNSMRKEAQDGYRSLSFENQEKILNCRISLISHLLGNTDYLFSRRIVEYSDSRVKKVLPLRKELTTLLIRAYNPEKKS